MSRSLQLRLQLPLVFSAPLAQRLSRQNLFDPPSTALDFVCFSDPLGLLLFLLDVHGLGLMLWVIFTHLVRSSDRPSTLGNKPERASRAQGPRHDGDAFGARQVIGPVFSPKTYVQCCNTSSVLWITCAMAVRDWETGNLPAIQLLSIFG